MPENFPVAVVIQVHNGLNIGVYGWNIGIQYVENETISFMMLQITLETSTISYGKSDQPVIIITSIYKSYESLLGRNKLPLQTRF